MSRVPVDDDGGEEIKASHAAMLTLCAAVADFALAANAQGILQGVMCFAFVKPELSAPLHVGIKQSFDDKECPFDPSDFTKCDGKVMPARVRGELSQELTGWHDTCHHGGRAA